MADRAAPRPKNIVLLSDGTGNSAAKLFKTNVWRIYDALDLSGGDQIAFYDNGVGTSAFKPMAFLGGALGWGLKRNVRDLYAFLCRNYRPGDHVFALGFSRGAFTIRVLIGLIDSQGIIVGQDGSDLSRLVAWAFRHYRRRYNATRGLVTPIRNVRDALLSAWDWIRRLESYDKAERLTNQHIDFVGVWDTVDAYGLPIDELTKGWDQWVWPLSMRDRRLSPLVDKACHVLSLDDERNTFHPLLWTEAGQQPASHIAQERITQVWFAGVHSNVGGGYPDDSLAHVSLLWMAEQAVKRGLLMQGGAIAAWRTKANTNGPIYDSRHGLAGYYRYQPRAIAKLSSDRTAGVSVARPKIHESAFERIRAGTDGYAPVVLPANYAVVDSSGSILDGVANPYEDATQSLSRSRDQEAVWDLVWWRRVVYFTSVAVSLVVALRPFVAYQDRLGFLDGDAPALSGLVDLVAKVLPALAEPWIACYRSYPLHLLAGGLLIAATLYLGSVLKQAIADRMRSLWSSIVAAPPKAVQPHPVPGNLVYRLRTSRWYRGLFGVLNAYLVPFCFGVTMLVALVVGVIGAANRAAFESANLSGFVCRDDGPVLHTTNTGPGAWAVEFTPDEFCGATGVRVERGERYRIGIQLPQEPQAMWHDGDILVTTPAGFTSGRRPAVFYPALPFRRVLAWNWFVPVVRVGASGAEYHSLAPGFSEFTARQSGRIFLYVNDALLPSPFWRSLYENNRGGAAIVTVTRQGGGGRR
ncbi:MAG TPA: DUF2235 domain-containing protein [Vicinamibacterales bacterium]|jgi:uncharacterized protein (DUF2235 family)